MAAVQAANKAASGPRLKKNSQWNEAWGRLKRDKKSLVCLGAIILLFVVAIFADLIADYDTRVVAQNVQEKLEGPSWDHWLGTDAMGRDIFARLVHGTRTALLMGFGGVVISVSISTALACIASYYGGKVDLWIMRVVDTFATIPQMVLAIAICAGLGSGLWQLMVALSVGGIPGFTRVIRSKAITVANMEYIEAAKALGAKSWWIILKYMVPNIVSIILIQGATNVSVYILMGATLSFVGLGVQAPTPEWGGMLSDGLNYFQFYPRLVIVPGVVLMLVSLAINMFGDCLRDAFDPQLKGRA